MSPAKSTGLKRSPPEDGSVSPPPVKRKAQSTITGKAVASFFTPASQKEPEKTTWRIVHESLLVGRYQAEPAHGPPKHNRRKVAAFDLDSTLISSASGLRFARDHTDWKWWQPSVPNRLQTLHQDGYLVVILSNQGGINPKSDSKSLKSDLKRLADFKRKVTAVFAQLDLPISIYAATGRDRFRKPRTGMWEQFLEDHHLSAVQQIDLDTSFFVGDAGGRAGPKSGGVSKDHSCSDRDFATNVGIRFLTPEEYFLSEEPKPFVRDFDPTTYLNLGLPGSTDATPVAFSKRNPLDVILFCGSPGAGKSTFYWKHLKPLGYERVNQDILKTREKCLKRAAELIKEGTPVVVDNTNPDPDTRAHWVKLARNFDVPIRCMHFTASPKLCEHNDAVRSLNSSMNPEKRAMLPKLAFTGFTSRYREPKLEEGFQDITKVDFMFQGTPEEEAVWRKFWV